ncbi:MAG: hypothetical protein AB7H80_07580, partial [Candidatus Kapaibacterium sp.]
NGTGGALHDRLYRSFSYPAALEYGEMGQNAMNEGKIIKSNNVMQIGKYYGNGKHYLNFQYKDPSAVCNTGDIFSPGDLIRITTDMTDDESGDTYQLRIGDFHVERIAGTRVIIQPYSTSFFWYSWLGSEFGSAETTVSEGSTSSPLSIEIIKSGKTNQLNVPRAGISTYSSN